MDTKTCGTCRAFDSGICRRKSPLADNEWPSVEASQWCCEHLGITDETGWLIGWPPRASILALCDGSKNRKQIADTLESNGHKTTLDEVVSALLFLTREGRVRSSGGLYYPVLAKPEQPKQPEIAAGHRWHEVDVARLFPFGEKLRMPLPQIAKLAETQLLMPSKIFAIYRFNLLTRGLIQKHQDGMYYR